MWPLQAPAFALGPVLLWSRALLERGYSIPTLAINPHQSPAFKAQVLEHAVVWPVDPFFYLHLFGPAEAVDRLLVADDALADRRTAFLLHVELPVSCADQLAAASQRVSLCRCRQTCQSQANRQYRSVQKTTRYPDAVGSRRCHPVALYPGWRRRSKRDHPPVGLCLPDSL